MKTVLNYLFARLQEASTWRGLIVLATGLGVHLDSMDIEKIVAFGLSAAGVVGIFFKDKATQTDPNSIIKK